LGARVVLVLLLFVASLSSQAAAREVGAIGLTVGDLDRALEFYTKVLPFEKVSESKSAPNAADELLGLSGTQLRIAELKLGDEHITLTEHPTNKGRPIPQDSRSFDHWFQHIAIVVRDINVAYERLRRHKVKHVSTAPQTLPAWNKDAGGIKAFYFRDPEDHLLEIIWFPSGKGDPKWQQPTTNLFLGIDHTAIVVSDTDTSLAFYRDLLGMRVAGGAENYGVEQEHLNQVFGARLRITALRAERGPGIEFLEYITPPGGRPLPRC
jgi:catechol 2,3-dioxygenase-like lactoylglutathione lyase family enzyme